MGLYSITTRADGTVLTGFGATTEDVFNGDHENHVIHTAAEFLNSWEATLSQMRATSAPVVNGELSLPLSLGDELERIRYVVAEIKQKIAGAALPPFWYTATGDFSSAVNLSPSACRIEQTAPADIPSATLTQVPFDTMIYDTTGTMASLTGDAIIAPVKGVYIVGGTLAYGDGVSDGPAGDAQLALILHPTVGSDVFIAFDQVFTSTGQPKALNVETVKHFNAGDRVQLFTSQDDGSTKQFIATTDARPALWMALVGRD